MWTGIRGFGLVWGGGRAKAKGGVFLGNGWIGVCLERERERGIRLTGVVGFERGMDIIYIKSFLFPPHPVHSFQLAFLWIPLLSLHTHTSQTPARTSPPHPAGWKIDSPARNSASQRARRPIGSSSRSRRSPRAHPNACRAPSPNAPRNQKWDLHLNRCLENLSPPGGGGR